MVLNNQKSSQELDIEKKRIEATITPKFEAIFKNLAIDCQNLYLATQSLNSELIANNYAPEFLKEIRDAMRKSIKYFGFNLRKEAEKKYNLFFDANYHESFLNLQLKTDIIIQDDELEPKLDEINSSFLLAATLFIANQSEVQNAFVTSTNQKMIDNALIKADVDFYQSLQENQSLIATLQNKIPSASAQQQVAIAREIEKVRNQILISNDNKAKIIGENIRINILAKAPSRSELISSQNVGLAESWARQTEASLIDQATLITNQNKEIYILKTWDSILDGKTRVENFNHVAPDGQTVGINEDYIVSGERLKYPRDGSRASIGNIARCRCNSRFVMKTRILS